MFLRHLEPLFRPFRDIRNRLTKARNIKGNIKVDVNRAKSMGKLSKRAVADAKKKAGVVQKGASGAAPAWPQPAPAPLGTPAPPPANKQGVPTAMQQGPGQPPGPPGPEIGMNPNPPVKVTGFFRKRKVCTQCAQQLDMTWDSCPYCAQAAHASAQPLPGGPLKTQAFRIDAGGSSMRVLGWLVPVQGPQKGELYTLSPSSLIGTDPTCTVVLHDNYMSAQHAEIKAEGGVWVLNDLRSTNGTYVNDHRVDRHELVDSDFIKFGNSLVKFKCL